MRWMCSEKEARFLVLCHRRYGRVRQHARWTIYRAYTTAIVHFNDFPQVLTFDVLVFVDDPIILFDSQNPSARTSW